MDKEKEYQEMIKNILSVWSRMLNSRDRITIRTEQNEINSWVKEFEILSKSN